MMRLLMSVIIVSLSLIACDKQATASNSEKATQIADISTADAKASPANSEESAATQNNAVDSGEPAQKTATSNGPQAYVEGVHYQRLAQPVPKANPNKAEVVEVFWYGCIHCYHFEPMVQAWKASKPDNVEFVSLPAVWNERLNLHAKMYYTAKSMGVLDQMHDKIFKAMNEESKYLASANEIADFFAANGVDRKQFLEVFNSFSVTSATASAGAKAKSYGIEGTPEVIVNGKFRTSARMADGQENIFKVVDYLLVTDK